ncbi:MAG: electron transfer flavoprotein subunit alpha/FixB family protein [Solobacterium sp.]|nr:electron transfer flavoprotein subunit alpha/FixB family protein [Solobacterium sp.]
MAKEIWVYAEINNGTIAPVTKELLAKSQKLAAEMGGYTVAAVLAGKDNKAAETQLGRLGAEKVYSLEHEGLEHYRADFYGSALAQLVKTYEPEYFLLGATAIGSELAPTTAGLLETGLAAHCIDLRWSGERLNCMVPAFGGKVVSEIYIPNARPVMASVRPGILNVEEAQEKTPEIIRADASFLNDVTSSEEFLGFEENESNGADIETAEIVFSAGRGAASDASWNAIQKLAEKTGGAIAWSRSFIDTGRVEDESCMIGTSGKSVKAKVLVNAGISGAAQYVCGINKCRTIISINKTPNAAIFAHSDYGVVGDADRILPAVLAKLQ